MEEFQGCVSAQIRNDSNCVFNMNRIGGGISQMPGSEEQFPQNIECQTCGKAMDMILHLYCPVGEASCHRILLIFACWEKECQVRRNCLKVFRLKAPLLERARRERIVHTETTDWGFGDDDDEQQEEEEDIATCGGDECQMDGECVLIEPSLDGIPPEQISFDESTTFEEPVQNGSVHIARPDLARSRLPESSTERPTFSARYINVYGFQPTDLGSSSDSDEEDDNRQPGAFSPAFQLCLADLQSGAVLRYVWGGRAVVDEPLPRNWRDRYLRCTRCGGRRVFEMQIFPAINNWLRTDANSWPLDFTTALIFCCETGCAASDSEFRVVEECVIVQREDRRDDAALTM